MHWDKDSQGGCNHSFQNKKTAFTKGAEVKLSTLKKIGIYNDANNSWSLDMSDCFYVAVRNLKIKI